MRAQWKAAAILKKAFPRARERAVIAMRSGRPAAAREGLTIRHALLLRLHLPQPWLPPPPPRLPLRRPPRPQPLSWQKCHRLRLVPVRLR